MSNKKRIGDPAENLLRERGYDLEVFQRWSEQECVGQPHLADQLKLLALSCKQLEKSCPFASHFTPQNERDKWLRIYFPKNPANNRQYAAH